MIPLMERIHTKLMILNPEYIIILALLQAIVKCFFYIFRFFLIAQNYIMIMVINFIIIK